MNHIIVYIDDADYAGQVLSGTLGAPAEDMHWTLVACAPVSYTHLRAHET